jgi:bla regulator protein blaR1
VTNYVVSSVSVLGNHLWQSTVVAAASWLLTIVLRNNSARTRYLIWMTVSAKFLLPFSVLVALGHFLPKPPLQISPSVYAVAEVAEKPFANIYEASVNSSADASISWSQFVADDISAVLVGLWLTGAIVVVIIWCLGWRSARSTLRKTSLTRDGREFEILRSLESCGRPCVGLSLRLRFSTERVEPSLYGILQPVLVWPEQLSERLDDEQIKAIMIHELEHARCFDNATAILHALVEALFWFYPPVWWMERRLIQERELACDEAVMEFGGSADAYAESLITTCRFCVESRMSSVAGVTGGDLRKRVTGIMSRNCLIPMTWLKKLTVVGTAVVLLMISVLMGQGKTAEIVQDNTPAGEQPKGTQAASDKIYAYEVVSIRPNKTMSGSGGTRLLPDGFAWTNVTLSSLVKDAYGIIVDSQVSGLPDWTRRENYDIVAKADADTAERWKKLSRKERWEEEQSMRRSILGDRCQFKAHREARELPVYDLVVAKGGLKMKAAPPNEPSMEMTSEAQMTVHAMTIDSTVTTFADTVGRVIVDKTGLGDKKFDFELKWTPDDRPSAPDSAPSLLTALKEQLGLKLVSARAPVKVLIIDHMERPSQN